MPAVSALRITPGSGVLYWDRITIINQVAVSSQTTVLQSVSAETTVPYYATKLAADALPKFVMPDATLGFNTRLQSSLLAAIL